MKWISFLLCAYLPSAISAGLLISVTDVPTHAHDMFTATVAGGNVNDPTHNPCYRNASNCRLQFFTIDETWLPGGKSGYNTADETGFQTANEITDMKTIGEWWNAVINKQREGTDFLPAGMGLKPCVVIAASVNGGMVPNTIISNCAKGIVQATSCQMTPSSINVSIEIPMGTTPKEIAVNDVSLQCSKATSVEIQTNSGESIPLGGSSASSAKLDWGSGFGKSHIISVDANVPVPIPLRVAFEGLELASAGVISGGAVVNLSYY